jgi:hypothetical protein
MEKTDGDLHRETLNRFIELANVIKDEGIAPRIVSASLMTASAVYATFVAAGNDGGLTDSGMDKVVDAYTGQLRQVQEMKSANQGEDEG